MAQPTCVPVRPRVSRSIYTSVTRWSSSTVWLRPFTVTEIGRLRTLRALRCVDRAPPGRRAGRRHAPFLAGTRPTTLRSPKASSVASYAASPISSSASSRAARQIDVRLDQHRGAGRPRSRRGLAAVDDGRGVHDREAALDPGKPDVSRARRSGSFGTCTSTSELVGARSVSHHVHEEVAGRTARSPSRLRSRDRRAEHDHHGQVVRGRVRVREAASERAAVADLDVPDDLRGCREQRESSRISGSPAIRSWRTIAPNATVSPRPRPGRGRGRG